MSRLWGGGAVAYMTGFTEPDPNLIPYEMLDRWLRCQECESENVRLTAMPPTFPIQGVSLVNTIRCGDCDEERKMPTPKPEVGGDDALHLWVRTFIGDFLKCPKCGARRPEWIDWGTPDPVQHHWRLTCEGCGHEDRVDLGWREVDELIEAQL